MRDDVEMYADAVTFKIRSISGPRVEMADTASVVHQHDFTDEFDPSDLPVERIYDALEAALLRVQEDGPVAPTFVRLQISSLDGAPSKTNSTLAVRAARCAHRHRS